MTRVHFLENELFNKRNNSEIAGDPGSLRSDRIIGTAIANYSGGTYARFEFMQYNHQKPGSRSHFGSPLDGAGGGLISGCTSPFPSEGL